MYYGNRILLIWAACGCIAAGCDPVRTTEQTFSVRVTDSASGNPIADATVQLKYDFDRGEADSEEMRRLTEEMREDARKFWERRPWSKGVTNKDGQAEFTLKSTALDRTSGSTPPANRDVVTGKPYLIKIHANQDDKHVLSILMKPGERIEGTAYSVTVIRINEPRYIEPP